MAFKSIVTKRAYHREYMRKRRKGFNETSGKTNLDVKSFVKPFVNPSDKAGLKSKTKAVIDECGSDVTRLRHGGLIYSPRMEW